MPISIELADAGSKLRKNYNKEVIAGTEFKFPTPMEDFFSTGVTTTDEFESTVDGDPVVLSFKNMTINAGHIVRPTNRCKGMFIYVEGDLIVNGQLTMTARGAAGAGMFVGIDPEVGVYINSEDTFTEHDLVVISPNGGNGGSRRSIGSGSETSYGADGYPGYVGTNGACGGGGGGGVAHQNSGSSTSGSGSAGTSFSGGAGGGGAASAGVTITAENGALDGGAGGNARAATINTSTKRRACGGGAGNPGGAFQRAAPVEYLAQNGGTGAGGLIILVVKGNIILGTSGKISSDGVVGGAGHNAGGGGSGGGAIHIFHKGTINDLTKITATGGNGGGSTGGSIPYARGGKGGNGFIGRYILG
jgi:hypothetical protein